VKDPKPVDELPPAEVRGGNSLDDFVPPELAGEDDDETLWDESGPL
jgi:hypothetical protein